MPQRLNLQPIIDALAKVKGVNASVKQFIADFSAATQKAVADALAADDAADAGSVDTANAAIAATAADFTVEADALAGSIVTNPGPTPLPVPTP